MSIILGAMRLKIVLGAELAMGLATEQAIGLATKLAMGPIIRPASTKKLSAKLDRYLPQLLISTQSLLSLLHN